MNLVEYYIQQLVYFIALIQLGSAGPQAASEESRFSLFVKMIDQSGTIRNGI